MSAGCESSAVGELRTPSREEMLAALVERQGAENVQKLQAATVAVCGLGGGALGPMWLSLWLGPA